MLRRGCRLPPNRAASASRAASTIRSATTLSFKSLGEMNYKNIPQPVRTFVIAEADGVTLYAAHQQKNNDDDEDQPEPASWVVAPPAAVPPSRQRTDQQQDQDYDEDGS